MSFASLSISPQLVTLIVGLLTLLGVFIWWIVRMKQNRQWYPILRILQQQSKKFPKIQFIRPPFWLFLSFLISALLMLFLSFKPTRTVVNPVNPNFAKTHILVDLTPSVSQYVKIEQLIEHVQQIWEMQQKKGKVSLSHSHSKTIFEPQNKEDIKNILQQVSFKRSGSKLATIFTEQLEQLDDANLVVIVTDADMHSWSDFNWRFLQDKMHIVMSDVRLLGKNIPFNMYIDQVKYVSSKSSNTMDWDVELVKVGEVQIVSGSLIAKVDDLVLYEQKFELTQQQNKLSILASWPSQKLKDLDSDKELAIVWQLKLEQIDAITIDNEFRTSLQGVRKQVLFVNEAIGEQFWDDPSRDLESIFKLLGFKGEHFDQIQAVENRLEQYPISILIGGGSGSLDRFCPQNFFGIKKDSQQKLSSSVNNKVWLVPQSFDVGFQEICSCFTRLIHSKNEKWQNPVYCNDAINRDYFANILQSLGISQVGGNISDSRGAIGWVAKDQKSQKEVVVFTVPLNPLESSLGYARFPLVIKDLLKWQNIIVPENELSGWLRISDILDKNEKLPENQDFKIQNSNVPKEESLMQSVEEHLLPEKLSANLQSLQSTLGSKDEKQDPLPWIYFVLMGVLLMFVVELTWWILKGTRKRDLILKLFPFFLMLSSLWEQKVQAVDIALIDTTPVNLKFSNLANELDTRTSLTINPQILFFSGIDKKALRQPWLWVSDVSKITDKNGFLHLDIVYWIKKGGFLIIQSNQNKEMLEKMTARGFESVKNKLGWQLIPPDHEIMRSFYLIDSLPSCNGALWSNFNFDKRTSIVVIPFNFLQLVNDNSQRQNCGKYSEEMLIRTFVNLLMTATTTDYKKDQIHLPEILKRLR